MVENSWIQIRYKTCFYIDHFFNKLLSGRDMSHLPFPFLIFMNNLCYTFPFWIESFFWVVHIYFIDCPWKKVMTSLARDPRTSVLTELLSARPFLSGISRYFASPETVSNREKNECRWKPHFKILSTTKFSKFSTKF